MLSASTIDSLFGQASCGSAGPTDPVDPVDPVAPTDPAPAPAPEDGPSETEVRVVKREKDPVLGEKYPDLGGLTTAKVPHRNLILDGVCTHCAHCGQQLTDSVSIQRGIGPVCSKRGYAEDPVDGDEMQAMIDLAEFPELAEFLVEHYKPLGVRGLVNGLVRAASLNRPRGRGRSEGNYKVHAACCDAIQSLGHVKLANLLRDTLVVVSLSKVDPSEAGGEAGWYSVAVKRRDEHHQWRNMLRARLTCVKGGYRDPSMAVRLFRDAEEKIPVTSEFWAKDGDRDVKVSNKRALWEVIVYCHEGLIMKRPDGQNVRIRKTA